MSNSPRRSAARPLDETLALAMQRLTNALTPTTDVDSRLAAARYAATLPPAPHIKTSVDKLLEQGRRELHATLEATTDVESRLILALSEIDLTPQDDRTSE
ncbi:hypothetical protein OHA37_00110 [Streptomyces sp. NBC_00335]|uniref:hypothetical protein n=1 Tax=unclassified Streptomyces TaxID=2593676 RepID=UPI002259C373|nr:MULTISPECIES: hypothetical protein [unclassified Streptomyces]MCX5410171.1 hypothetical protein [Streptomyces sp. NBC_00086]